MKKIAVLFLAGIMILSSLSFAETTGNSVIDKTSSAPTIQTIKTMGAQLIQNTLAKFKDVKSGEWYMDSVSKLVELGGIKGYEDDTFRPTGTITRAEYTSIVARSLGIQPKDGVTGHWSAGIMAAATDAGLVNVGEFKEVDKPITRFEMARMAIRAVNYQKETVPADWADYTSLLSDLKTAPTVDREAASMSVAMGIISGYPDKTFQGAKTLSRAEASAVVIRILDKDARKVPNKPSAIGTIVVGETKPVTEFISNMESLGDFNPGLKTVTLVASESLGLVKYPRLAPYKDDIRVKGQGGYLIVIKGGIVTANFAGVYAASIKQTLYDGRNFGAEITEIDYFGFSEGKWGDNPTVITLVANPWKE